MASDILAHVGLCDSGKIYLLGIFHKTLCVLAFVSPKEHLISSLS
jgi:hypothetical protein